MYISKKIKDLEEFLDIDLQLIATELDTSANNMRYLCAELMTDAIAVEAFNRLYLDIIQNGVEITSYDDNTIQYDYLDNSVIIYTLLDVIYIIFDNSFAQRIENQLKRYK